MNKSFRDSQRRTRLEVYRNTVTAGSGPQVLIEVIVTDPITNTGYSLNPQDHTARQISNPYPRIAVAAAPTTDAARPTPGVEFLGTETLEGLLVQGVRTTRTIATGAAGNDRPLQTVSERWVSPDLHLPLLTKTNSPLIGDQTVRVFNIDRSEPDPALFEVPPNYRIEASQ